MRVALYVLDAMLSGVWYVDVNEKILSLLYLDIFLAQNLQS